MCVAFKDRIFIPLSKDTCVYIATGGLLSTQELQEHSPSLSQRFLKYVS